MMSQSTQKNPESKQITWDDVLKFPTHQKINTLRSAYPKDYQSTALKLIENAGLESHDLLYWQIVMDIHRTNSASLTLKNSAKTRKDLPTLLAKLTELDQKVDANHELILQELSTIKLNVDLGLESTNGLIKGVTNSTKKRKEKTQKEIWKEWITSPTGIAICCIGLIVLIFK